MSLRSLIIGALMLGSGAAFSEPLSTVHIFADGPVRVPHMPSLEIFSYDLSEASYHKENPLVIPMDSVEQAQRIASDIQNTAEYQAYMDTVKQAYFPYKILGELGISRIPAIVFNRGTHVVYGTTDIGLAIENYYEFIQRQGGG